MAAAATQFYWNRSTVAARPATNQQQYGPNHPILRSNFSSKGGEE